MAYDAMGNFTGDYSMPQPGYGYETEEERRRREEEERKRKEATAQPVTQKITYNPDGTQKMTISGTPEALSSANPNTPTIVEPVNPADTFNRMVQAESGGKQYNAQGGILTSPAGAQGMAQIMPATARNPGYGVKPATPEEIATPEGNRAFGERYFQGLLQHFGGDQQKAVAAYNAGPGAVGRNVAANRGQLNTGRLPGETQGYLNKVLGGVGQAVNAVMPSAQAGTLTDQQRTGRPTITPPPAAPVAPMSNEQLQQAMSMETAPAPQMAPAAAPAAAQAPSPYALTAPSGQGLQIPGVTPTAGQPPVAEAQSRFQSVQDNVGELMKMREDPSQPEYLQQRARERAYELMKNEQQKQQAEQKAKELIASGDGSKIADALKGRGAKGEEGSWLKMIMLGYLNPTLAGAEAVKLGLTPTQWSTTTLNMPDGTRVGVEIQTRSDGKVLKGTKMDGTPLTTDELSSAAAQISRGKVTTGAEFFQDKSGNVYQSQRDEKGNLQFVNTQTNQQYNGKDPLQRLRDVAAVDVKRQTTMIQMAKDLATMDYGAKLKAIAEFREKEINAGRPDFSPEELALLVGPPPKPQQTVGGTTPAATTPAATPAAAAPAAPVAPTPVTSGVLRGRESVADANKREAEDKSAREVTTTGRKDIVKDASQIIGEASKLFDKIDVVDTAIKKTNEPNNLGQIAQGTLPGERRLGQLIGTKDARNTDRILEGVKLISAEGMKVLGANPTDADRDYLTANIPNETWSADETREWLESRRKFLERKYDIAKKQVSSGGTYTPEMPAAPGSATPTNTGTTSSGNKYKRVQ